MLDSREKQLVEVLYDRGIYIVSSQLIKAIFSECYTYGKFDDPDAIITKHIQGNQLFISAAINRNIEYLGFKKYTAGLNNLITSKLLPELFCKLLGGIHFELTLLQCSYSLFMARNYKSYFSHYYALEKEFIIDSLTAYIEELKPNNGGSQHFATAREAIDNTSYISDTVKHSICTAFKDLFK